MSYDLVVFEPSLAPPGRKEFLSWFENQADWHEEHNYDDPTVASGALRSWFLDIISEYPAMNGPYAADDLDSPRVTDYSVGKSIIYAAFAWSQAEDAYRTVVELVRKHGVGFFDISGTNEVIWRPTDGSLFGVFYCFNATGSEVPSDRPVAMSVNHLVNDLMTEVSTDRDFIGLTDTSGTTLQFMFHASDDRFWVEIPCPEEGGSYGAFFNRAELESTLRSLSDTIDRSAFSEFVFQSWG